MKNKNIGLKIILLSILVFLSVFAYAKENIEFHSGLEYCHYLNFNNNDIFSNSFSIFFGFVGTHYFNNSIGLLVNMNLNIPFIYIVTYSHSSTVVTWIDNIFWIGIDGFIGPNFNLLKLRKFIFSLSPGIHLMSIQTIYDKLGSINRSMGIGANFGYQWFFSNNIYISLKVFGFYHFISGNEIKNIYKFFTDKPNFDNMYLGIKPMLGIGLKL